MTPSLSASIFSTLLASASPTQAGVLGNGVDSSVHGVKSAVGCCIGAHGISDMESFSRDLQSMLADIGTSFRLDEGIFSSERSRQWLLAFTVSELEKNVSEIGVAVSNGKGVFELSRNHWNDLVSVSKDKGKDWQERLVAIIRLISIVNFFTLLPGVYGLTIYNAYKKRRTPSILFGGFTISNGLGATGLFLAETPLEWSGYAIATAAAAITMLLLRYNEKNNLLDEAFMEHMQAHTAFSVYDLSGRMLHSSDRLLDILGTTKEAVFAYQEEHGEVVTLFYPEIEERNRIDGYQSDLRENGQAYEAIFFPRRVDNGKKLALHFNTVPKRNKKGEIIGTYRFAEDVTGSRRDNTDLLTGESDKYGFEKSFHSRVLLKKQREIDCDKEQIISVVYSDLDGFKKANDIYSHRNADVVLKEFAQMARRYFRADDTIARLGGDEFGFICDGCTKETALKKLNILRDELSRTTFEVASGTLVEWGRHVAASRAEALEYEKLRNLTIKEEMESRGLIYDPHLHCCIGGVGVSAGVTDFEYGKNPLKEEEVSGVFTQLEQQCERVMAWAKNLDALGIGATTAKNTVGMTILDEKRQVVGAHLHNSEREEAFRIDRRILENESERIIAAVEASVAHR